MISHCGDGMIRDTKMSVDQMFTAARHKDGIFGYSAPCTLFHLLGVVVPVSAFLGGPETFRKRAQQERGAQHEGVVIPVATLPIEVDQGKLVQRTFITLQHVQHVGWHRIPVHFFQGGLERI